MIGFLCKYTPIELFYGLGETPRLIDPAPGSVQEAAVHPNLCSFAKAAYGACLEGGLAGVTLTNCCDSIKRISDMLEGQTGFHALLSLPRMVTPGSVRLYAGELKDFIRRYEAHAGVRFDPAAFRAAIAAAGTDDLSGRDHIAILGARAPAQLSGLLQEASPLPLLDLTCTGQARSFGRPPETDDLDMLMEWYAGELLSRVPCMRMQDAEGRRALWAGPHTRGIVYHTVKFCDYYGFEYAGLKSKAGLPVLKLETDYTGAADGQLKTRIQAFFESMAANGNKPPAKASMPARTGKIYAGIDSGSTSTDAVLLREDLFILGTSVLPTGGRAVDGARATLAAVLSKCGLAEKDLAAVVATGYGRSAIGMGDPVTEITCHAKGAFFLDSRVRTIIDIGGQDSKIIKLDEAGNVVDFSMNDKCAAGTGRFLEMMASTLGMELSEFARAGLKWEEDIHITSMCSVFAESEVISLVAQNKKRPDIVHGINASITARIFAMISRLDCAPRYMMTGGVAKNKGVAAELMKKLGQEIILPDDPQICGALGAALIAAKK